MQDSPDYWIALNMNALPGGKYRHLHWDSVKGKIVEKLSSHHSIEARVSIGSYCNNPDEDIPFLMFDERSEDKKSSKDTEKIKNDFHIISQVVQSFFPKD